MDLQIYNLADIEKLPTVKYTVQIVKKKSSIYMDKSTISKSMLKFLNKIEEGDLILLEYPPIFYNKSNYGVKSFRINVTNLTNNEMVSVFASKIVSNFWDYISEVKVIE